MAVRDKWIVNPSHFEKSIRSEVPSLVICVPLALIRSKTDRASQTLMLMAALTAAEKQMWLNFWTGDESRIM
jgi:hypothetical protein